MNEKLFRGKREDGKGWVQSGNIIQFLDDGIRTVYMPHFTDRCDAVHEDPYDNIISIACKGDSRFYSIIPETVGQYIGRVDKNGEKIFEGDVVKTKYGRICKVVWFSPQLCWDLYPLECKSKAPDTYDLFKSDNLEVIGNIHGNPEILKEGNKLYV